jgi:hypothetical protein
MNEFKLVYKYFYDYYKIFKNSTSSNVCKWTQSEIDAAIKWSRGVEDVYKRLKAKKYFNDFQSQLILILKHWEFPSTACDDFHEKAGKHLKKVTKYSKVFLFFSKTFFPSNNSVFFHKESNCQHRAK